MMKKMVNGLKVKTGPQFYLYEEGGISKVSDLLKSYGAKKSTGHPRNGIMGKGAT